MQKPQIVAFTYHHKNTSIEYRDLFSLNTELIADFIKMAHESSPLEELAVVSTCNRTEFYGVTREYDQVFNWIIGSYKQLKNSVIENIPEPQKLVEDKAITHLLSVAAGLESMVLGENQILAQVKSSYDTLLNSGCSSPLLNKLLQQAIKAGKAVRSKTALCQGAVSISLAAVELSRKIFNFEKRTILVIGAGETADLVATHFRSYGAKNFIIANRNQERANVLAEKFSAQVIPLEKIAETLSNVDIVVAATGSPVYLLNHQDVKNEFKSRSRSLLLLDISTPRNIDPKIADISDVFLYNIDDLQGVVNANLDKRKAEIPASQEIIQEFTQDYLKWIKSLELVPTIKGLVNHFDEIRSTELQRFLHKVDQQEYVILEELSKRLTKKLLHYPISSLQKMNNGKKLDLNKLEFIREMYRLKEQE